VGLLVRHGQEPTDTPGHGVLGQLWVGELPKLLQGCLLVRDAQATGLQQVGGDIVPQDLEGALDAGARGDGGAGTLKKVATEAVNEFFAPIRARRAELAADADLKEKYIWAVNSEQQATPSQISSAIDYVRQNQVPAVFCESTVSDNPMRQVADAAVDAYGESDPGAQALVARYGSAREQDAGERESRPIDRFGILRNPAIRREWH